MTQEHEEQPKSNDEAAIGMFTTIGLIFLLWGFCWLKSYSSLRVPQVITVAFHEVAGLTDNAAVFLDGVRIGVADHIDWQGPHRVLVRLRINRLKVEIPQGSKFNILTNGIVGAKFIEVMLPEVAAGYAMPPPISKEMIVEGEDPVRPELAVNKLAIGLSNIDMDRLQKNIEADRKRWVLAADQLAVLAQKAMPLTDEAVPLEKELLGLSRDLRKCTARINSILGGNKGSKDLQGVALTAKQAAETLQATVHELSTTLHDEPTRKDILAAVDKLDQSTQHLQNSLELVRSVTDNKPLRDDVSRILTQANQSLDKIDTLLKNPSFGSDVKVTLQKTQSAVNDIDLVARQLNQILNKRQPLIHLMVGRPGFIRQPKQSTGKSTDNNNDRDNNQ